jgi:hypothetical protein
MGCYSAFGWVVCTGVRYGLTIVFVEKNVRITNV